ncbi:DUF2637 domain-containing protein [Streptosporangiaceae bacterium NEAU-GS5]|nr:DUF2637 domain-containing protein [Streptosporangiaceae bacterium NEAU-GS5]
MDRHPSSDRGIRLTTTVSVLLLAAIAAVVSFRHMHELALLHGEDVLAAALIPLAVDGTIVAASMSLLLASRYGSRGGLLPWTLLIVASLASLGANMMVAEPSLIGRAIAGWPSFALIGAYEMLMRQVRRFATLDGFSMVDAVQDSGVDDGVEQSGIRPVSASPPRQRLGERAVQRQAWQWAQANPLPNGGLPTGEAIAGAFQRSAR